MNSYEYIWILQDNCLLVELFGLAGAQWFFYILSKKQILRKTVFSLLPRFSMIRKSARSGECGTRTCFEYFGGEGKFLWLAECKRSARRNSDGAPALDH